MKKGTAPPSGRSALRRALTRLIVLAAGIFLLIETQGIPHVRMSQNYRLAGSTQVFEHNRYWSPLGIREVNRDLYNGGLPFLVLLKPEPSLTDRLRSAFINTQPQIHHE